MGIAILTLAFILVLAGYVLFSRAGGISFPWIQFYVRGKESGFSFSETGFLRRVAVRNKMENPTSLFWSVKALDRCIRAAVLDYTTHKGRNQTEQLEFLNKLFVFRRRVEFDQPKYRLGITSTREISPGQTLKITPKSGGVYISKLVENNKRDMVVTYPRGKSTPPDFSWRDQTLKVYFWRREDAGYYFESKISDESEDESVSLLHMGHSDNVVRAQKRRSVRREVRKPALLFPLRTIGDANETVERQGGYRCNLLDISEDGLAVAIGGRAKAGLPVKIQVELNEQTVVVCGLIKTVDFKQRERISVLHIQAQPLSVAMKVKVLSFVYALFSEGKPDRRPG